MNTPLMTTENRTLYAIARDDGYFRIESDLDTYEKAEKRLTWYYGTVEKAAREGRRIVRCTVIVHDGVIS